MEKKMWLKRAGLASRANYPSTYSSDQVSQEFIFMLPVQYFLDHKKFTLQTPVNVSSYSFDHV